MTKSMLRLADEMKAIKMCCDGIPNDRFNQLRELASEAYWPVVPGI
jgi:hypothetical protein